jgi:ATP-dependent phosphofructokinase / diphosphate-dependent phosphofructokinase
MLIGDEWAQVPLEDGLPRFARFSPIFAEKRCPPYVPQAYRDT